MCTTPAVPSSGCRHLPRSSKPGTSLCPPRVLPEGEGLQLGRLSQTGDNLPMTSLRFDISATDGAARRGRLSFDRGTVETPAFMPVGTYGSVKAMTPRDIALTEP